MLMTRKITYLETMYRCRCQCGQVFYVSAGHCQRRKQKKPHLTAAICPGCLQPAWLEYRPARGKRSPRYEGAASPRIHASPTKILHDDVQFLEETMDLYQSRYMVAHNNLVSLEQAVRMAIAAWKDTWKQTVMPKQFANLIHCLKELEPEP